VHTARLKDVLLRSPCDCI